MMWIEVQKYINTERSMLFLEYNYNTCIIAVIITSEYNYKTCLCLSGAVVSNTSKQLALLVNN